MTLWLVLLTITLPWLGALLVWRIGNGRPRAQHGTAVIFAAAAGLASLLLLPHATTAAVLSLDAGPAFGLFTLVPDSLAILLAAIAAVIGSLAVLFSVEYMRGEAELGRYYALVLLFIGAMAGLAFSGSLLLLFLFWEVTALCSYALIAFHNDDPRAVRGGLKALIITQLGGVGLLLGALVAYAYLGDGQISTLLARAGELPPGALNLLAFGFLLAAMAKSAQVPLHTWLPDAMEAPTPVSALIHAATMVNAGVYLLIRFYPAFAAVPGWATAVVTIGLLSALLAAVMALTADDLKRVLAYSTISQLGVMVYAVGVGGLFAAQFHLFSHAIFKALLFLGAGAVIHAAGTREMRQMGGLWWEMRLTAVLFALGTAALAGLPLLNGFWSKELVLEAGLAGGPRWAYAGMVVGAALTALYSSRMFWLVFLAPPHTARRVHDTGPAMRAALLPLAAGVLAGWLLVGPLSGWLAQTLPFHHLHTATTADFVRHIVLNPATVLALAAVGLGILAWWGRGRLAGVSRWRQAAVAGFGFEWLNRQAVYLTQSAATVLQWTQTGQLNWNVFGIVLGLVVVLLVVARGG
jgi:NADH-quinone oxidoreductase subunit L